MTKQQTDRYNRYRDYIKRYGCRSIYVHYDRCSPKKSCAWKSIDTRRRWEDGFCFTIVSGGSHYFSTGYLRRPEPGVVELVYDYKGGTDYITLTKEQRQELSKILCQEI